MANREDEAAIRDLVARHADAVNRRAAGDWVATWAEDGVWELMGRTLEGRDVVRAAWEAAMAGLPLVFHQVYSGVVEVDGDSARGRWTTAELLRDASGRPLRLLALYHDVYTRGADGWRFARRRLEVIYYGPADLSASPEAEHSPKGAK